MMYERFTDGARAAIRLAEQEAKRLHHQYVGTDHLLLGLLKAKPSVALQALWSSGIRPADILVAIEKIVLPIPDEAPKGDLPQAPRAKKALQYASEEATILKHNYVGTEHLLLGLIREEYGVAAQVLTSFGVTHGAMRELVLQLLDHGGDGNKVSQ